MPGGDQALLDALGSPRADAPVPAARSAAWNAARQVLNRALQTAGLPAVQYPAALWALIHDTPYPHRCTWGQLCAGVTLDHLERPLAAARRVGLPKLLIWNVRYLRSTTAHKNQIKLATITHATAVGRVALLQETHWSDHDACVWATMFPARRLVAAPAVRGPGGGWSGGVAILLPDDYTFVSSRILVPGRALTVTATRADQHYRFVSVYLPPGQRMETLDALAQALPAPDGVPTFWGGRHQHAVESPQGRRHR